MPVRVGILTGGGDAPGLNAVIRAFVYHGTRDLGLEVIGVEDAFCGLLESPRRLQRLDAKAVRGLLPRGGTILGTTNRGDPFAFPGPGGPTDRSADLAAAVREEGLDGLVCIGGEGTQGIARRLAEERGIRSIGVPKTIDNDLGATDFTFGFFTAVDICTEAIDRLHTTAESHDRVILLEVMGRDAGHIALYAGLAGGVDAILLPEIPWDPERIAKKVRDRQAAGARFSLIVVAEGALPATRWTDDPKERKKILAKGGAAAVAMAELADRVDAELRACVLGHIQRGGSPGAFDRILATRFGVHAAELAAVGRWGRMVRLAAGRVDSVPLDASVTAPRLVDPADDLVATARATGIELGA